jgi:hypothetical protein
VLDIFLRTKRYIACVNGFENIDPDTLDTLDPSDESIEILLDAEALIPVRNLWRYTGSRTSFFRAMMVGVVFSQMHSGTDFDPTEFAFYINYGGRRSRKNFWCADKERQRASVSRSCIYAGNLSQCAAS